MRLLLQEHEHAAKTWDLAYKTPNSEDEAVLPNCLGDMVTDLQPRCLRGMVGGCVSPGRAHGLLRFSLKYTRTDNRLVIITAPQAGTECHHTCLSMLVLSLSCCLVDVPHCCHLKTLQHPSHHKPVLLPVTTLFQQILSIIQVMTATCISLHYILANGR